MKTTLLKKFNLLLVLFIQGYACSVYADSSPIVEKIQFNVVGGQPIDEHAAKAYIPLKEGMPYADNLVGQSIKSLYGSGVYDAIEVQEATDPSGQRTWITFLLQTRPWVQAVDFKGSKNFTELQLSKNVKSKPGSLVNELQIQQDIQNLLDFYRKKGYPNTKIDYSVVPLAHTVDADQSNQRPAASIIFTVSEGQKVRLSELEFRGNVHVKSKELTESMTLKTWGFFSWLTGSGVYEDDLLQKDLESLTKIYHNFGFLDVVIAEDNVQFHYPQEGKLVVSILIEEGPCYHVGDVTFSGNTLYPSEQLTNGLPLQKGQPFSMQALQDSVETLKDAYGRLGYLEAIVGLEKIPHLDKHTVDVAFTVEENGKFYVDSVILEGNTKTKSNVILRELALAPGDLFDSVRMKVSEDRLRQTMFFEEVTMSPEPVAIPNRRNLRIALKEKNTGNIQTGIAFSSVERATVFIEVTQSNFDIFNRKNFFQGGGQKFRTRLSLGNKSSLIFVNFEEPALFDKQLAVGIDLLRSNAKYVSSMYDELRYSAELYARKRLFELFVLRPYYKIEVVDIHNLSSTASSTIRQHAGKNVVSQLGAAISRETIDSFVMPTRGSRFRFSVDLAGVGGNVHFVRPEVQAGKWWPTFKTMNQVFSVVARTGTIVPYKNEKVPFFETYYLGGPNNLRGYSYRDIGPKDETGESIGGNTYAFASAEYSFQILDPVRLAAFYDVGFVNAKQFDWSTDNFAHDVGVGARIFVAGAPIRLDFAYPLRVPKGMPQDWEFNLSFGTVF